MVKIVVFLVLLLPVIGLALGLLVGLGGWLTTGLRGVDPAFWRALTGKSGLFFGLGLAVCLLFALLSQWTASTPDIVDSQGRTVPDSVAELLKVDLNGRREWISIRGQSADKPILLFLAGGPGGSHLPFIRQYLPRLEEHFLVVNWDQPGSGKSFFAVSPGELTVSTYVEDGVALTKYLCERFGRDKIYLLGESWGSALGVMMAAQYPQGYHAFFGTGQMVAFLETELVDYNLALDLARDEGRLELAAKLEANGPPPYYGGDLAWKSQAYLGYLDEQMNRDPRLAGASGNKAVSDLLALEFGIIDKVTYFLGLLSSFNQVYPQLYPVDLRVDYPKLEVPVFFLLGRLDLNAPLPLALDYYEMLQAPYKELIWFEHSGHAPWAYEREKFGEVLLEIVGRLELTDDM